MEIATRPGNRLLVVDDDPSIHILMTAIFRRRGFTVEIAADGRTALDRLRREHFDAVILDLMLPGPNGYEIVRELKSRDTALLGRTILLTAARELMLRDFDDGRLLRRVMTKPFVVNELVDEVLACVPPAGNLVRDALHEQHVH